MPEYAPGLLLVGLFASPLLAFMFKGSLTDDGAILLGCAIFLGAFTASLWMNVGACRIDWLGHEVCNPPRLDLALTAGGIAGAIQLAMLALTMRRLGGGLARRSIYGVALLLSVPKALPVLLSIGPLLILASLALFGWLAIKDPPLRESELTPPS